MKKFATVATVMRVLHEVGDFMTSTDVEATRKPCKRDRVVECSEVESWKSLMKHVAKYHAVQVVGLVTVNRVFDMNLSPKRMTAAVAFSFVTHTIIDRRWPVRMWLDNTGSPGFKDRGGMMYVDQTLHQVCILGSAFIATGKE
jgi:hypothetical protein